MRLREAPRVVLCAVVLAAAFLVVDSPSVAATPEPMFQDLVMIYVDCNNASVMTMVSVGSDNDTLIHFPSSVDLKDIHLENAVAVSVMSSSDSSILMYSFENISETEAETNADAVTPSISSAVGVSFAHSTTETVNTEVHVNYTGPGQSDMASFVNSMLSECVYPDVNGLADAIPSLATQTTTSALTLSASRESPSYDWLIGIGAMSLSTIPTGSNSHTIDVLALLGVSSLAPSPYSYNATQDYYLSIVWLYFESDTSIGFVSCEPPEKEDPYDLSERGWTHMFFYAFYFGNDPSPVEALTFTFSGTVIPEFTSPTIIITLILTAACIIAFKKRMLKP